MSMSTRSLFFRSSACSRSVNSTGCQNTAGPVTFQSRRSASVNSPCQQGVIFSAMTGLLSAESCW